MTKQLTKTHSKILDLFPATAEEIADAMNYSGTSTVYDHIAEIRKRGHDVAQSEAGKYYQIEADGGTQTVTNHVEPRRQTSASKATITRKANEYLTELEQEVKPYCQEVGPTVAKGGLEYSEGGQDIGPVPKSSRVRLW